jgi:hypothetical protein
MKRRQFLKAMIGAPAVGVLAAPGPRIKWVVPTSANDGVTLPEQQAGPLPGFQYTYTADDLESTTIRATQIQCVAITELRERVNGIVEALTAYGYLSE